MNLSISIKTFITCFCILLTSASYGAGLMKPKNSQLPDLQIKSQTVDVVIENGYVTTSVEQIFSNPNDLDLEALYSFPVPKGAAVGEFIYWINGNPVVGEVFEKKAARTLYEQEKAAGRNTALVEQDQYKTFDISVSPVLAQSEVKVRLVYVQAAHTDLGIGRYVYPLEDGGVDEQKQAFWTRNDVVQQAFNFNLSFRSSYPIDALRLPNHPKAKITQVSDYEWSLTLTNRGSDVSSNEELEASQEDTQESTQEGTQNQTNAVTLDQDIVVYWRHKDGLPGSVDLVTYKPKSAGKGTFMLTLTPGSDLGKIEQGSDWVFVLDISGSMGGKYATLVEGVRQGLGKLRADDRYKIILFNDSTVNLTGGFVTTNETNINQTLTKLENYPVGNGTNLYAGLSKGLDSVNTDRPTGIILVTDGVANVGKTEKSDFLNLLQKHDVRLFTFVMGNSANEPMLAEMTKASNGFAISVSNSDDILGQILLATTKLTHQAYTDIKLDINGVKVKNLTPDDIQTLYQGQQLQVFGHYWQSGDAEIRLTTHIGTQQKVYQTKVHFPDTATDNPELERLWAFASIEQLQARINYLGSDSDAKQAITDLAIEYGLVTQYTSMVVVEEQIFEALSVARTNKSRVENEQAARELRKAQGVQNNRVDQQQPMFNSSRPSTGSGGGSVNLFILFTLVPLAFIRLLSRRRVKV